MARRYSLSYLMTGIAILLISAQAVGSTGYDALQQPVNGRVVSMNGAFVAHAGDPSALFWNPAGLASMEQTIGELSYENHILDVNGTEFSIAMPLWRGGAGFGLNLWNYGTFDQRDNQGNVTGSPTAASEFWLTGGYGLSLSKYTSIGLNTQLFVRNYANNKSTLLFWSLGWQRNFPDQQMRLGITASHWGTNLSTYQDHPEALPKMLTAGISKKLLYLPLRLYLDAQYSVSDNDFRGMLGGEFTITESENLFLRLGLTTDRFDQVTHVVGADFLAGGSFGFGFRYQFLEFDYGAQTFGGAGMVHAFTLKSKF